MSVSSKPGPDAPPIVLPRRRWLLPVAIVSTLGLVLMTALVLVLALAVRSTRPSEAAEHDPNGPLVSLAGSPQAGIPPFSEPEPPASVTLLTTAPAPAETAAAASVTFPSPAARAAPAAQAGQAGRVGLPRNGKKSGPRRDVYRPF